MNSTEHQEYSLDHQALGDEPEVAFGKPVYNEEDPRDSNPIVGITMYVARLGKFAVVSVAVLITFGYFDYRFLGPCLAALKPYWLFRLLHFFVAIGGGCSLIVLGVKLWGEDPRELFRELFE